CEGACVLNQEHKRPVMIGALQRHATDYVMDRGLSVLKAGPPNGKRIALVGAGPASFGCAAELARMGYACRIYEKRTDPGGLSTRCARSASCARSGSRSGAGSRSAAT